MFDSGIIGALSIIQANEDDQINWPPGRCDKTEESMYMFIDPQNKTQCRQYNMDNTEHRREELFNLLSPGELRFGNRTPLSSHGYEEPNFAPTCYLDNGAIQLQLTDNSTENQERHIMTGGGIRDFFKSLFKFRSFDKYIQEFEAARTKIGKKMIAYEAETARLKTISTEWSDTLKKLFLNEKYKVMWTIMRDKSFDPNKNPKHDYKYKLLTQDIKRIEIEQKRLMKTIDRLRKSASEKMNLTFKIFGITIFTKKDFKIGNVMIVNNYIGKFKQRLEKDQELFLKVAEGFNDFTEEISKATELKAMYAIIGGKDTKELTSTHRKEADMYMKNKETYEKMLSFTESRRDELLQLIQRKEKMFQDLDFYRDVLEFGGFDTIHGNIRTVLDKQWTPAMTSLYGDLESAIEQCGKWKKVMEGIKSKVSVNGNQIGKLTAGKAEFTPIKREYETQLENIAKVIDTQSDISATLAEIKNNFIKLVPDVNLLPDMFHVASAQGFVLEMMNHIKQRQEAMGKDMASATEAIKKKLVITGGNTRTSNIGKKPMTGGMILNLYPTPTGIPMFLFNNAGYIWDDTVNAYIDDSTQPEAGNMNLFPLPLGLRMVDDNSVPGESLNESVNEYIDDIYPDIFINAVYNITDDSVTIISYAYDNNNDIILLNVNNLPTYDSYKYNEIVGSGVNNYYFYMPFDKTELDNNSSVEYKIFNQIKLIGSDLVILPIFYNTRVQTKTIGMNEYILISPFNGKPIISFVNNNPPASAIQSGYDYSKNPVVYDNKPVYAGSAGVGTSMHMKLHGVSQTDQTIDISNSISNPYALYFNYCNVDEVFIYGKDNIPNLADDTSNPGNNINYGANGYYIYLNDTFNITDFINSFNPADKDIPKQQEIETMSLLTQYINKVFNKVNEITFSKAGLVNNINGLSPKLSITPSKLIVGDIKLTSPYNPQMQHIQFGRFNYDDLCLLLEVNRYKNPHLALTVELLNVIELLNLTIGQVNYDTVINNDPNKTIFLTPNPGAFMMAPYGAPYGAPVATGAVQPAFIADPSGSGLMIPNPAAGTYNPILVPKALHPSITKALDYLKRIIDSSSPYWSNLKDILAEIEKFFSKDFLDYEQLLMKILDQMFEVREFEDKVLKIDIGKDKDVMPSYSYIYKNLEVKVDPSSKEGYSSAGKALYEKLKQNREYVKYNKATLDVNPENILYDLTDDLFMKILADSKPATAIKTSFFSTGKGIKYKEYLQTREGAEALLKALSSHTTFGQSYTKAKIVHVIMLALITYTSDPDVYKIYSEAADLSISRNPLGGKKGGKKDDKKDPNKKSGGATGAKPSGGGGGGGGAPTGGP